MQIQAVSTAYNPYTYTHSLVPSKPLVPLPGVYAQDQLLLNTPPKPPPTSPQPDYGEPMSRTMKIALISAPVVAGLGIGAAVGGPAGAAIGATVGAAISYIGLWWAMTIGNPFN